MPVEQVIWKLGQQPERLSVCSLDNELQLEGILATDPGILNENWMLIGRQVTTAYNKVIDLLALDSSGCVIVIELKKDKTAREVVAQAIDYASWVQGLGSAEIAEVYQHFARHYLRQETTSLDEAFQQKFSSRLDESELNGSHQIVIVASELDSSSERIVKYLSDFRVPVNVIFFRVFSDGDDRYLSRAWLIDPVQTQENATSPRASEPWNGEYYVSFGHGQGRDWEEARTYGFISAGGGSWYTRTLRILEPGSRVWANIPRAGYVGVGIVEERAVKIDQFRVKTDQGTVPLLEVPLKGTYHKEHVDDEDMAEYAVRVKWIKTVPVAKAISELGFFGNQNTVCKPTTPKWSRTIERLKSAFGLNSANGIPRFTRPPDSPASMAG